MKKYLLALFTAFAIFGCKQNLLLHSDAEIAEMMKNNLQSGISRYDIVSFYVTNWSDETLMDVFEEQYKTFDFSLNDSALSVELGRLNSDGVKISKAFFYPYTSIDRVVFSDRNQLEGTVRLTITLKDEE